MSQEPDQLSAVVQIVQSYLNTYLQNYSFRCVSESELQLYKDNKRDYQAYKQATHDKKLTLVVTSGCSERNFLLCLDRVDNFVATNEKLNVFLSEKLQNRNINLKEDCNTIEGILKAALVSNNSLSASYAAVHRSYKQNALAGNGIFASWWKKTFFQSRATIAIELALDKLDECRENLGLNTSPTIN